MKERKEVKNGLVERSHNWMNNWGKEERERKTEKKDFLWREKALGWSHFITAKCLIFRNKDILKNIFITRAFSPSPFFEKQERKKNLTFFHLNWIQLKLIFYITSALLHFYLRLGWCFPRQVSALVVFCLLYPCTLPEMDIWALGEAQIGTAHSPISSNSIRTH